MFAGPLGTIIWTAFPEAVCASIATVSMRDVFRRSRRWLLSTDRRPGQFDRVACQPGWPRSRWRRTAAFSWPSAPGLPMVFAAGSVNERLTSTGTPDATFGSNGRVELSGSRLVREPSDVRCAHRRQHRHRRSRCHLRTQRPRQRSTRPSERAGRFLASLPTTGGAAVLLPDGSILIAERNSSATALQRSALKVRS